MPLFACTRKYCAFGQSIIAVLLVLWTAGAWAQPHFSGERMAQGTSGRLVRVAAAADLKFALDEINTAFHAKHPDITVQVSYGSSGNFFAQLSNRAPFDMFFSADVDYPRQLIAKGVAAKETEFLYAVGRLVVWVPRTSTLDLTRLGIKALVDPSIRKIAIANPKHAPYGRAAEAAMKTLGVYEAAQERLVYGENIAQTAQFVQTGAADIGIIALSLAVAPALKDEGRFWEVPLESYPRIEQGGIILSWATDTVAAQTLRAFVLGEEGRAVLHRYGFFLPEP
jgi:molybdate transport system substrate-binding protein